MSELIQADLIPAERQEYIINLIQQKRAVRVSTLSEVLGVSEITIRRDLEKLEEQGILERTHGGAILTQRMRQEPLYIQKERIQIEAKRAIGKTAAGLVNEGETIFINSGSTTRQIFSHLGHIPKLRVITSNAAAIAELDGRGESLELIVVGGTYRWQSNSLVGPIALSTIAQINASKTFLGVDGISVQRGLTTPIQDEAEVARTMITQTHGSIIVVADHTKIGVVAEFVTCPLKQVTTIVTDTALDDDWRESLAHDGIRIVVANSES
jgi:DeoR/GlpR family transcriptional regulator of sugar metabolism